MNNTYFKLFANCIPVKGASRSVICDLQRNSYELVPNSLYDLIELSEGYSINDIVVENHDNENIIMDYFDYLVSNEFGFFCEESELLSFPKLDTSFHHPSIITNAILDFDSHTEYDIVKVTRELNALGCKAVQLRFIGNTDLDRLESFLQVFDDSRIRHIDMLIHYSETFSQSDVWQCILNRYSRLIFVMVYGSPMDSTLTFEDVFTKVYFSTEQFTSEECCGVVSPSYFSVNFDMYFESVNFNSCLNRKISVDRKGNIKNCPSMHTSFGHVSNTALGDVIAKEEMRKLWNVSKDNVQVCKDCEFRYICTDCRAHLDGKTGEAVYAKPLKCTYDPYTCQWME